MNNLADKHFLVVGLGKTGASAVRFLVSRGARVTAADSREQPPAMTEVRDSHSHVSIRAGALSPVLLDGVDELLVSPGVDLREPLLVAARERGLPIHGDIEWFARCAKAPVVAITGSNGKSTVTAMVAAMAHAAGVDVAVGGNFGTPALDLLADDVALYVLELSSFQLELTTSLAPRAACVLNISADHIDRHGSLECYAELKARIFHRAEVAVINRDDARVANMPTGDSKCLCFGDSAPQDNNDYGLIESAEGLHLACGGQALLAVAQTRLCGRHNFMNALAAIALGRAAGLPQDAMLKALRQFEGLPHRCQWVANIGGVDWINDSKGTNVGALLASLQGMDGPIVLLAGGQAKGGDFSPLAPVLSEKVKLAVLFGEDAGHIEQAIREQVEVAQVADLRKAVNLAASVAVAGDTVLLSPGCASLDMFRNYEDRGEQFSAAVLEMAA